MTFRHLYVFKVVCDEGSFTKAAEKLYMTQPAVSHVISDMEAALGTCLFDRISRKIYLTEAGKVFLRKTKRLLELYDSMREDCRELDKHMTIRIGSTITIANFWLPVIIKKFEHKFPDTPLKVCVDSAKAVMDQLEKNNIDIALVEGTVSGEHFHREVFGSYKLSAACAPEYLAEDKRFITGEDLSGFRLLLREKGSAIREVLDSALRLMDITVEPEFTSVNSQALIRAAAEGIGITILPDMLLKDAICEGTLVNVTVEDLQLKNQNHIVYHKEKFLTDSMKGFIDIVLQ